MSTSDAQHSSPSPSPSPSHTNKQNPTDERYESLLHSTDGAQLRNSNERKRQQAGHMKEASTPSHRIVTIFFQDSLPQQGRSVKGFLRTDTRTTKTINVSTHQRTMSKTSKRHRKAVRHSDVCSPDIIHSQRQNTHTSPAAERTLQAKNLRYRMEVVE